MDRFGLWNLAPSSPMNGAVAFNIHSHEGIQGCLSTSTPNTSNYWHTWCIFTSSPRGYHKAVVAAYRCGSDFPWRRHGPAQKGRGQSPSLGVKCRSHHLQEHRFWDLLFQFSIGAQPLFSCGLRDFISDPQFLFCQKGNISVSSACSGAEMR